MVASGVEHLQGFARIGHWKHWTWEALDIAKTFVGHLLGHLQGLEICIHYEMINRVSLVTIYPHTKLLQYY